MDENIRKVTHVQNIRYDKAAERLYIIDQTLLPNEERETSGMSHPCEN